MLNKQDVLKLIDDQLERINDSYTMDDAAEVSLLMLRNKVENMPECTDGEDERQQSGPDWKESVMEHFTKVE